MQAIRRFHDRDFVPSIFRIINLQHVALNARDVEIARRLSNLYAIRADTCTYVGYKASRIALARSLATVRFIHSGKVNRERAESCVCLTLDICVSSQ